jgi:hypothetical protein
VNAPTARALTLPGLLLALVLTSTLPAWADAASARPADPATACAAGAAVDTAEGLRC